MHFEPCPGVQGIQQIRAACEPPQSCKCKGVHRDSASYELTKAKEPNSDVAGGKELLSLSKLSCGCQSSLAKPL